MEMIFLSASHIGGFRKWPIIHSPANHNDDPAGGATPVALPTPATDERIVASPEQPPRPWLVQGVGSAL